MSGIADFYCIYLLVEKYSFSIAQTKIKIYLYMIHSSKIILSIYISNAQSLSFKKFVFLIIFTGHVTIGGSICMEMLTRSGWTPTNDIEV